MGATECRTTIIHGYGGAGKGTVVECLPYTGTDLTVWLVAAVLLLALGFALRAAVREARA